VKIVDLFPKQKRVVGFNQYTGKRTAFALKKEGAWEEMMNDIYHCTSVREVQKCRWFWAQKVIDDLWPEDWIAEASVKFDEAVEALAAQQAE